MTYIRLKSDLNRDQLDDTLADSILINKVIALSFELKSDLFKKDFKNIMPKTYFVPENQERLDRRRSKHFKHSLLPRKN